MLNGETFAKVVESITRIKIRARLLVPVLLTASEKNCIKFDVRVLSWDLNLFYLSMQYLYISDFDGIDVILTQAGAPSLMDQVEKTSSSFSHY